MESAPLPPELEGLERLLACGVRPVPSSALRARVLGGVRSELRRGRWGALGRSAAALACVLLMDLCLSVAVVLATSLTLQRCGLPFSVQNLAQRSQQPPPEPPREELLRQATLFQVGVELGFRSLSDRFLGETPKL